MTPIVIDHHRTAYAHCTGCVTVWATDQATDVPALLSAAAEHAMVTGHTVAEHIADDATVHPTTRDVTRS